MQWFYRLFLIITATRVFDLLVRSYDYLDNGDLDPVEIAGAGAGFWAVSGFLIALSVLLGLWKNTKLTAWACVAAGAYFTSLGLVALLHAIPSFPDGVRVATAYASIGVTWFVVSFFWNGYAAVQDDREHRGESCGANK